MKETMKPTKNEISRLAKEFCYTWTMFLPDRGLDVWQHLARWTLHHFDRKPKLKGKKR